MNAPTSPSTGGHQAGRDRTGKSAFDIAPVRALWSLWVILSSFAWMAVVFVATAVCMPMIGVRRTNHYIAAPGMAQVLKLAFVRLTVTHDPGFDRDRTSVFCFNHVNLMDAHTACNIIPQPFVGLMKASHFKIPIYGWVMKWTRGIPVFPRDSGRTSEMTAAARDRVQGGMSILTFPEGHRTLDGRVRPFRTGVFFMARDAGIQVVPVAVRGMYEVNRKGTWMFRPGRVHIHVGAQVDLTGLDDDAVRDTAARLHRQVADFVHQDA